MTAHQPKGLLVEDTGETCEPYGINYRNRDAAFCAAMIRAGHRPTGMMQIDPRETRLLPRPFAGTHVLTSSCADFV